MKGRGFLKTVSHLASHRHPEDQLTNIFAACFNTSRTFREVMIRMIAGRHGSKTGRREEYECATQVQDERNRHDIVLRPSSLSSRARSRAPHFVVENKLDAPLTKPQLLRYRSQTRWKLSVLTRDYPDVTRSWLKNHGIADIRWHDVHRELKRNLPKTNPERFICREFLSFLEDLGMAYNDVTLRDLGRIGETFKRVALSTEHGSVNSISFLAAQSLLDLLSELKRELEDAFSAGLVITGWGPGYYNHNMEGERWHYLGFNLKRQQRVRRRGKALECAISFPESRGMDIYWGIYGWDYKNKVYAGGDRWWNVDSYLSDGVLDRRKLFNSVVRTTRRWNFF